MANSSSALFKPKVLFISTPDQPRLEQTAAFDEDDECYLNFPQSRDWATCFGGIAHCFTWQKMFSFRPPARKCSSFGDAERMFLGGNGATGPSKLSVAQSGHCSFVNFTEIG
ncbi:unnamed protein product [Protopolystoma xenopodis]|uniref:Uncharacterized protein n=1 Tax=Protopolystoma xenopodis TaxID=117903 RepID=A0A3S5AY13_9PLAT|nr:unnamed protein product [Protopolystoma xenopodis]